MNLHKSAKTILLAIVLASTTGVATIADKPARERDRQGGQPAPPSRGAMIQRSGSGRSRFSSPR